MLRQILESNPETLQDFELAAEQKYWEGLELSVAGHGAGGIYLLGYAAEMILKHAGFRLDGHRPATPLSGLLAPAKTFMRVHQPAVAWESYHSVLFWTEYLRTKRSLLHRPLPTQLDAELMAHTRSLYAYWWIEMRYRPDQARPEDARIVYNDVSWFRANRVALWS